MVSLSLVMPVLNRASLIDAALDSVAAQAAGHSLDIVIVDGGSTDGTQTRVRDRSDPSIRLIAAPGSSVYQALNIGIEAATAAVIGNLNSDDVLAPGALDHLAGAFQDDSVLAVHGASSLLDATGHALDRHYSAGLDCRRIMMGTPAINALFVRRAVFDRVGLFDERWRIASDRDWLLRLMRVGIPVTVLDRELYRFRTHAGSLTMHRDWTKLLPAYDEYRSIAEAILSDPAISSAERYLARIWHARQIILMLAGLVRQGKFGRMAALGGHAFVADPVWPIIGGRWLARRLTVGGG